LQLIIRYQNIRLRREGEAGALEKQTIARRDATTENVVHTPPYFAGLLLNSSALGSFTDRRRPPKAV